MLNIYTGRAGTGKTRAVMEEIAAAVGNESGGRILVVPEQYGGLGLNAVTRYCISEELAKHDAGFTISNNSYSFGLSAILADGTEAQKQAACARILRGEGISMAITEPQSGSDVGSTRTSAMKVDGGYVLNGV